jgi:hypothetical protein
MFLSLSCVRGTFTAYYLSTKDIVHAVDLDVIKARTNTSESAETRGGFRAVVEERDVCCVCPGSRSEFADCLHIIIPFQRGSEVRSTTFCREGSDRLPLAISVVLENRPCYIEDVTTSQPFSKFVIFARPLVRCLTPLSPPITRLQTTYLNPGTFPHATTELVSTQMSVIRLVDAIPCNGWKTRTHPSQT